MRISASPERLKQYADNALSARPETLFPLFWSEEKEPFSWVTNTFDRTVPANIRLIPLAKSEPWPSIADLAKRFAPKQILAIFAPFLQIDAPFDRAILSLGMSTFCVAEERIQMGLSTAEQLEIGGIVLTQPALTETLQRVRGLSLPTTPYLQVVLGPNERPLPVSAEKIYYEIHLVPGMPGLLQCEHLAGSKDTFHPSPQFVWEHEGETLWVTDSHKRRFVRARFPQRALAQELPCPCGTSARVILL